MAIMAVLSLHVVIYLQNEFKHKPKMAFYMYNVLYGSAVSFMRGTLKLLFLLGDNNGPTSSITILKITYQLSWYLVWVVTFKEILGSSPMSNINSEIILNFFPLEHLPSNRLLPASLFSFLLRMQNKTSWTLWWNDSIKKW